MTLEVAQVKNLKLKQKLDKKKSGGYVKQYANGGRVAKYNKD